VNSEDVTQLWRRKWPEDAYLEERLRCIDAVLAIANERPIITVIGSAADGVDPNRSEVVGVAVAASGLHLLTGGRGGVMRDVTRAFLNAPAQSAQGTMKGLALAVLPAQKAGNGLLPAQHVIQTQLPGDDPRGPGTRNHVNILVASTVVTLPGGSGTAAEAELAASWYHKPIVAFSSPSTARGTEWNEWHRVLHDCRIQMISTREELARFIG